ncbi:MAG: hypothetical protein H9802_00270, partial [Candidatus Phocaeicola faecipullorum]|nr:hypothetical protein [Candidatus Phocaeicola faecipullorum]
MNKKFSTFVAALFAAGALVMPADMFAELRYAQGATYSNVETVTSLPEEGEEQNYFIVFQYNNESYVAVVNDSHALEAVKLAEATMDDVITITYNSANSYTVATGENTMSFNTSGNDWGTDIQTMYSIDLTPEALKFASQWKSVSLSDLTFTPGGNQNQTFNAKAVSVDALETVVDNVAATADEEISSSSYLLMDNGRVLADTNEDGKASWVSYDKAQNQYWTIEVTDNGNNTGSAKFKNKATGKYLTKTNGTYQTVTVTRDKANDPWKFDNANAVILSEGIDGITSIVLGEVAQSGTSLFATQLTSITGNGFEASIKKYVDGDKKDKDLAGNPFSGLLKTVQFTNIAEWGTSAADLQPATGDEYMLQNEDGDIIVVDLNSVYAAGASEKKYALKAIDPEVLANALKDEDVKVKGRYLYNFKFWVADDFVIGSNQKIASITVSGVDDVAYNLGCTDLSGVPTLSAEKYTEAFQAGLTIKVGTFNTISVKDLLGSTPAFFTVMNVNTKAKYSDNYETVLGLNESAKADYVKVDEALIGYPETQWAIRLEGEKLVLANRERPTVTKEYSTSQLYKTNKANVFAVLDGTAKTDTIEFKANTSYTDADGYLRLNAAELRDQSYYVAAASSIFDNVAYLVENHGKNHQVGLDTDKENATEWNMAASMYRGLNNLSETIEYRPDTIVVESNLGYYKDGNYTTTSDQNIQVALKLLAYSFQNSENSEYLAYVDEANRYATGDFDARDGYKNQPWNANIFAIKIVDEDLYNLIPLDYQDAADIADADKRQWENISTKKMYSGDGATKGILNNTDMYNQTENDLFTIEKKDAPEYREVAMSDTIRIYRNDDPEDVLFEKGEFLGTPTSLQFDKANPALFVDTAYINRPYNNRWEYLLAVDANHWESNLECDIPGHPKHEADTTTGRFLVGLMDSAYVYNETHLHNNKFINEEDGERYAKLGFVEGYHTHDTLYLKRPNGTYDKIAMDRDEYSHSIAKFAFRYVDNEEGSFVIETGCKSWNKGEPTSTVSRGFIKWLNGTLVVVPNIEAAEIFNMNEDETRTPTANEEISANGEVSVIATDGAVIVKGAEGKNVVVSTILGKVVANEVLNSDNETIAAPAGIVV